MSEEMQEKDLVLDVEDEKETIEVNLEKAGLKGSRGDGEHSEEVEAIHSRLAELEEEKEEILRRLSMAIGDSRLALENADRSLKDVRRLKKDSEKSVSQAFKRLDGFAEEISRTVETINKFEELESPVKEIQSRMSILEEVHERLEKEKSSFLETLEKVEKEAGSLKEMVEELRNNLEASIAEAADLKEKTGNFEEVRARIENLEKTIDIEIKQKIDSIKTDFSFEDADSFRDLISTINDIKTSQLEKFSATEDRMEELKAFLAVNMGNLEEKFKGFREETFERFETFDARVGEGVSVKAGEFEEKLGALDKLREDFDKLTQKVNEDIENIRKASADTGAVDARIQILSEISSGNKSRVDTLEEALKNLEENLKKKTDEFDSIIELAKEELKTITGEHAKKLEEHDLKLQESLETIRNMMTERIESIDGRLSEVKETIEKELHDKLDPMLLEVKGITENLDDRLDPFRDEIKTAKSHLEEELIKVKEAWEKVDKAVSDSGGAMEIAQKARESLDRMEGEIKAALSKIDSLIRSIDEGTLKTDNNKEKIDLTIKLIDEARERIKGIQAPSVPVVTAAAVAAGPALPMEGEMVLTMKEIMESPDMTDMGFELDDLLQVMIKHEASDLHLKSGSPPTVRMDGELIPVGSQILNDDDCKKLVLMAMTPSQRRQLAMRQEVDFAYAIPDARFRVNAYLQKQSLSASFRLLRTTIPGIDELHLPDVLKKLSEYNHGLILVTGPAGSGKSTTLASMINYINETRKLHIVTVEDPIEFIHQDKMSIITQREVGTDTKSFGMALKQSLRQDPNVILIGEMRDPETIMTAALAAETGHLVLSTLHTPNTIQAINRILDVFTGDAQKQFRLLLANTLRGIVSQRLLSRVDETGRIPAVEVLVATPTISSLILEEKTGEIYQHMAQGRTEGMQTFTNSLADLYEKGLVSKEEAMYHADQPTEFRLSVEGHTTGTSAVQEDSLMSWL